MNVVKIPVGNIADVPNGLRTLADAIENGEHGDAHNIAWVIDVGNGAISTGILGASASPAPEAYFLFALAQRHIERGCDA